MPGSHSYEFIGDSVWTRSGQHFFFEAGTSPNLNIWVARERGWPLFADFEPRRLTNGEPGSWRSPASDPTDESSLFAINAYSRPELVRYDSASESWKPEWDSVPAFEVSYSPDRDWAVYTRVPDYSIWKIRKDGTGRTQLTHQGIEAHQPHWSPDGQRIAFMGKNLQGHWRVFQIQAAGGTPEELFPHGEDQGVATWSPEGNSLIFGERLSPKPKSDMSIHVLDLKSRRLSEMPGTRGLWSPRWSPDGKHILAITSDSRALRLLENPGSEWKEVIRMMNIDDASWSPDSHYVYFKGNDGDHVAVYRFNLSSAAVERIVGVGSLEEGADIWFGVAPDGAPLALRNSPVEEIYRLMCRLP
jgi:dipeptidyl aminopeptidase/acylaminoacyl peptidase